MKSSQSIGAIDEIGLRNVDQPQPVKNLHATILTAFGVRPDDLFFETNGCQERLSGVAQEITAFHAGETIQKIELRSAVFIRVIRGSTSSSPLNFVLD